MTKTAGNVHGRTIIESPEVYAKVRLTTSRGEVDKAKRPMMKVENKKTLLTTNTILNLPSSMIVRLRDHRALDKQPLIHY